MNTAHANRVLVVDDDPDLLRLLSIRIDAAGYRVATARNAEQALNQLSADLPNVVITDVRMDGMDGMSLFDAIHRRYPMVPVIILTAHGSIPDAVQATNEGVFAYLTKPFDNRELLGKIAQALRLTGAEQHAMQADVPEEWSRDIITRSAVMKELLGQCRLVAESDASVFITGESGTGKELIARSIHWASARSKGPFIAVNCSAIPETLLESELFGHNKGSFTGATQNYIGLFKAADGGTLFLDEIGDMALALQAKLLRTLQERQVRPLGSTEAVPVDVRIISATHKELEREMQAGNFRQDLYYRLNVVHLSVPSLSERREDVPLLAAHFFRQLTEKYGKNIRGFAPEALELLVSASWPGNVRQLLNVVEHAVVLSTTPLIPAALVRNAIDRQIEELPSLADARREFEREYLACVLRIAAGNVAQAARLAKRNRTEFYKLLRRYQIDPAIFKKRPEGAPVSPADNVPD